MQKRAPSGSRKRRRSRTLSLESLGAVTPVCDLQLLEAHRRSRGGPRHPTTKKNGCAGSVSVNGLHFTFFLFWY